MEYQPDTLPEMKDVSQRTLILLTRVQKHGASQRTRKKAKNHTMVNGKKNIRNNMKKN